MNRQSASGMKRVISIFLKNKEVKNANWIIGGKIIQMILSFVVGLWTARYLGPSNYGLINYVASYTAFFTAFCTLGITSSIIINEFTNHPEDEGVTIGSTIIMRLISSALSVILVVGIIFVVDKGESETLQVAVASSVALLFQVYDTIEYWFQKRYLSKVTAIASTIGYCVTTAYRVFLLVSKKSAVYFALATSIDYIVIAIVLYFTYKRYDGPKLRFSLIKCKNILSVSYHFILSGLMVAIYGQTDKVMLKHMLSETEVGYYSTASAISTVWAFVLAAIITSIAPSIMQLKKSGDEDGYLRKNRQLYGIVFYVSIGVSACFTIFAPLIIKILYGNEYLGSIDPLRMITWYVAFSYLGVARDHWMVCEGKQKYSKYMYIIACFMNIALNAILIPYLGATGAALASLITQIGTSIGIPLLFKDMRPNVRLMIEGILLKDYRKH